MLPIAIYELAKCLIAAAYGSLYIGYFGRGSLANFWVRTDYSFSTDYPHSEGPYVEINKLSVESLVTSHSPCADQPNKSRKPRRLEEETPRLLLASVPSDHTQRTLLLTLFW